MTDNKTNNSNNDDSLNSGELDQMKLLKLISNLGLINAKFQEVIYLLSGKDESYYSSSFLSDPNNLLNISQNLTQSLLNDPQKLMQFSMNYQEKYFQLWQNSIEKFINSNSSGEENKTSENSKSKDRRFRGEEWDINIFFNFIKEFFLVTENWINEIPKNFDLDNEQEVSFFLKQISNALSPANFLHTNPKVLKEAINTGGDSILNGLDNMIDDLRNSNSALDITTTDKTQFELGENIATAPGKVIYQNQLMQLICYEPEENSYSVPLLITPPWINKYYVLDLTPEKSLIKWLTSKGYQVFIISWRNPDESMSHINFQDYMNQGVIEALTHITDRFGYEKVNLLGYCLGGTLNATAAAYLKQHGRGDLINSLSFFATLLDFSIPGDLGIFTSEKYLSRIKENMRENGYFSGNDMRTLFSLLRSNEMIWSFFVNNYLLGKTPFPFDILYWNSDSTNLPAAMHEFYLENMYNKNLLAKPGGLRINDTKIDLSRLNYDSFFLSTKEDHITPWQGSYKSMEAIGGDKTFCLAGSGHVAGVVNPPAKNKYYYLLGKKPYKSPESWYKNSEEVQGSWWPHWEKWLRKHSGELKNSINYSAIKDFIEYAPGSYVRTKIEEIGLDSVKLDINKDKQQA